MNQKEVWDKLLKEGKPLNLYLVTQSENRGYDTFDGFVVAAKTEQAAKEMTLEHTKISNYKTWVSDTDKIKAQYIGDYKFKTPKIILGSFNAA